jgi:hypothetical protein
MKVTPQTNLQILSLNIEVYPPNTSQWSNEKIQFILKQLTERWGSCDFLILQNVYRVFVYHKLKTHLSKHYPYSTINNDDIPSLTRGLVIYSKHPIKHLQWKRYPRSDKNSVYNTGLLSCVTDVYGMSLGIIASNMSFKHVDQFTFLNKHVSDYTSLHHLSYTVVSTTCATNINAVTKHIYKENKVNWKEGTSVNFPTVFKGTLLNKLYRKSQLLFKLPYHHNELYTDKRYEWFYIYTPIHTYHSCIDKCLILPDFLNATDHAGILFLLDLP